MQAFDANESDRTSHPPSNHNQSSTGKNVIKKSFPTANATQANKAPILLPPRHPMLISANFNAQCHLAFVAGMPMSTRCDPNIITFQPPTNIPWGRRGKDYESLKRKPRRCKIWCLRSDCTGAKAGRLPKGVERTCQYLRGILAIRSLIFEYLDIPTHSDHRNRSSQANSVDEVMKKILHI